jgi:hypothetical protein
MLNFAMEQSLHIYIKCVCIYIHTYAFTYMYICRWDESLNWGILACKAGALQLEPRSSPFCSSYFGYGVSPQVSVYALDIWQTWQICVILTCVDLASKLALFDMTQNI